MPNNKYLPGLRETVAGVMLPINHDTSSRTSAPFRSFPTTRMTDQMSMNFSAPATCQPRAISAATFVTDTLPTWLDRSLNWRNEAARAFRSLARASDRPLSAIMMTNSDVAAALKQAEARCHPMNVNQRSLLKCATARMMGVAVAELDDTEFLPEWQVLFDSLPLDHDNRSFLRIALIRLLRFCSRGNILPAAVRMATLQAFETELGALCRSLDPAKVAASTARAWNKAVTTVPGWPPLRLFRRECTRAVTMPLSAYPPQFQADTAAFLRHLACSNLTGVGLSGRNPYRDLVKSTTGEPTKKRRRKPAREATLTTRAYQILLAAAGLVRPGTDTSLVTSLRCLVDPPENARTIADYHWKRTGEKASSLMAGLLDLMRQVARFVGAPGETIAEITEWMESATPKRQASMTAKNATRLRQFRIVENRAALLHLPTRLMKLADACAYPREAALAALQATALEILLICPMRLADLQNLRLGVEVQNLEDKRLGGSLFNLSSTTTKNEEPLLWAIPEGSRLIIAHYVRTYRPILARGGGNFLFPGLPSRPRSLNAMREAIEKPAALIRIRLNPHLLRHFAVWLFLRSHPGQYELARRILNHKRIETTIRYYCGLEAEIAAATFDKTVFDERQATAKVAKIVFSKVFRSERRPKRST
jgi:integrase